MLSLLDTIRAGRGAHKDADPAARDVAINGKPFVLDVDASERVRALVEGHPDLIDELSEFALPPFDRLAISCTYRDGTETLHLWRNGEYRLVLRKDEREGLVPGWNRPGAGGLVNRELDTERDALALKHVTVDGRILAAIFLLLNQPSTYRLVDMPARSTFRKGKIMRFMASSEIVLTIDKLPSLRALYHERVRQDRLAARRHEVRRHWWHFGGDRGCAHVWEPDALQPRRYVCSCGRIRRERGPFERGDASRGFVSQHYKVEDRHV